MDKNESGNNQQKSITKPIQTQQQNVQTEMGDGNKNAPTMANGNSAGPPESNTEIT
jgi:hypothetical protein